MRLDRPILFSVIAILCIGLLALYSASKEYYTNAIILRQFFWILFGLLLFFIISHIDYQRLINISYFLYGINIFFLILVLFIGEARGGAHRWINIGAFSLQPSELAKITLVLALSTYIGTRRNEIDKISFIFRVFCIVLPVFFLILVEPDLGSALLLIPITIAMLFIGGARITHIVGIVLAGLASLPLFWHFLRSYQKQRLFVFLNPNVDPLGSGYTIIQSKIAVGSGGLLGKGWLSGTQSQLNFLPERHTDFIFSVIGEEWGFLGALILILLYVVISHQGIKIIETTPNIYGRLVATGFVSIFILQVIINIGMTIGFLPIVGLTLPLISYGGSSLITTLMYIAILLNVDIHRSLF